jgi:hypothetical protein
MVAGGSSLGGSGALGCSIGSALTLGLIVLFTLSLLPAGLPLPRLTSSGSGVATGSAGGSMCSVSWMGSDISLSGSAIF